MTGRDSFQYSPKGKECSLSNKYVYCLFIRDDSDDCPKNQRRGYIAGRPKEVYPYYDTPFIVVRVDRSIIKDQMLVDDTIRLNLEKLQKPNTTEEYVDENGDTQTRIVYDYFHAKGKSSEKDCPVITLADVIIGGMSV